MIKDNYESDIQKFMAVLQKIGFPEIHTLAGRYFRLCLAVGLKMLLTEFHKHLEEKNGQEHSLVFEFRPMLSKTSACVPMKTNPK
jgi:hypothetical protein